MATVANNTRWARFWLARHSLTVTRLLRVSNKTPFSILESIRTNKIQAETALSLEGETHHEFDLSWSTERVDTRPDPNAIHVVANDERVTYGGSPIRRKRSLYRGSERRGSYGGSAPRKYTPPSTLTISRCWYACSSQ